MHNAPQSSKKLSLRVSEALKTSREIYNNNVNVETTTFWRLLCIRIQKWKELNVNFFLQRCDNKETVVKLQLNVSSFELNIKTTALSFLF